jgi:hypothetical protein
MGDEKRRCNHISERQSDEIGYCNQGSQRGLALRRAVQFDL